MRRLIFKVHKWVGIGIGVILLMWIVTGILIAGGDTPKGTGEAPPDFSRATVAPAAALALATSGDSALTGVRAVEFERLGPHFIYRVRGKGRTVLVDAERGVRFLVDEALARRLAAETVPGAGIRSAELIRSYDRGYGNGSLPVWRVTLDDAAGTLVHLSQRDGVLGTSTSSKRMHLTMHNLHTFATLKVLGLPRGPIRWLLVLASVVSLVAVLTGYYMSLPKRWTRG
ncbi:MAG: PepSY domain-containing protein [Gemmatimonadota bacterium]|nr:PepSY domain-containing protein [Gemmatimonadota bacterium]